MTALDRAFLLAEHAHKNQMYGIYPYIFHPREVVAVAELMGFGDDVKIPCALHDCIEDDALSFNDIKNEFGEKIAEIVFCVSDELGRNRKERKAKSYPKIRSNKTAIIVKICDRYANIEFSATRDKGKLQMYINEMPEFRENLEYMEEQNINVLRAWGFLNQLVDEILLNKINKDARKH